MEHLRHEVLLSNGVLQSFLRICLHFVLCKLSYEKSEKNKEEKKDIVEASECFVRLSLYDTFNKLLLKNPTLHQLQVT